MIIERSRTDLGGRAPRSVEERIQQRTEASLVYHARHPERIDQRLEALDAEWSVERTFQTQAAVVGVGGTILAAVDNRRWLLLPALASGFLLQHAVQGWCPPVALLRQLGVRWQREIEAERYALKALRGDFQNVPAGEEGAHSAVRATGRF